MDINNKQKLFDEQKKMLDTFLKTGTIDKIQYEKSLDGLKEKMGVNDDTTRPLQ